VLFGLALRRFPSCLAFPKPYHVISLAILPAARPPAPPAEREDRGSGARPANPTCAVYPPTVAVRVFTDHDNVDKDDATPSASGGFTAPNPVQ